MVYLRTRSSRKRSVDTRLNTRLCRNRMERPQFLNTGWMRINLVPAMFRTSDDVGRFHWLSETENSRGHEKNTFEFSVRWSIDASAWISHETNKKITPFRNEINAHQSHDENNPLVTLEFLKKNVVSSSTRSEKPDDDLNRPILFEKSEFITRLLRSHSRLGNPSRIARARVPSYLTGSICGSSSRKMTRLSAHFPIARESRWWTRIFPPLPPGFRENNAENRSTHSRITRYVNSNTTFPAFASSYVTDKLC